MNALKIYRLMYCNHSVRKMVQTKIINLKNKDGYMSNDTVDVNCEELQSIDNVLSDYNELLETILKNTEVPCTKFDLEDEDYDY